MRILLLLFVLLGMSSCGLNGGIQRGYVISHSVLEDLDIEQDEN